MDASVDPCDDFYQYACGGWIDKHSIPIGRRSYSSLYVLNDEVYSTVAELLKNATRENHTKAVIDASVLFQGCIDEGQRERRGLDPLRNLLNSLGGWPMINPLWTNTSYEWYKQVATMSRTLGIHAIISIDVEEDRTGNSRYNIILKAPDFGVENQYFRNQTTESAREVIAAYRNYIISTARLLNPDMNETSLENDADEIIEFESDLAAPPDPIPREKMRKVRNTWYQNLMNFIEHMITKGHILDGPSRKMALSDLQRITQNENFKWTDFLNDLLLGVLQVTDRTEIMDVGLEYIKHALDVVHNTDPRIVANYIGWVLVNNIGHHTTKDFRDKASRFQKLVDKEWTENLEISCVTEIASVLDFAVARLYSDKYITQEEMQEIEELVEDIRAAFEVNFNHNTWMDPTTKGKALQKLRNMENLIGYPSWIKVDSELNDYYRSVDGMKRDEYFGSFMRAKEAMETMKFKKWNLPIHRINEWSSMSLLEVNAMYMLDHNVMYFPAAIFNPPIYTHGTVPALNYAGVGSWVAHEITHGFDNDGRHYDKDGKRANWWSEETAEKFEEKVKCVREQYSEIVEPMTNTSLRGWSTLSDDIADNGAVRNAFMAYRLQVLQAEENQATKRNTRLPDLSATPEQLYFLALASWKLLSRRSLFNAVAPLKAIHPLWKRNNKRASRSNSDEKDVTSGIYSVQLARSMKLDCSRHTERSMKWTIENDSHSPPKYRIRLPLRNSRAFAEAFNCPLGSPMNPELKCQLW